MTARAAAPMRRPLVPNGVMGMFLFVLTEVMLFLGMISAFSITKASVLEGWPPLDQPRLPAGETALNTVALLLSGVALYLAHRAYKKAPEKAKMPLLASILLGSFFVIFQGMEWSALLAQGLTITSGPLGGFFYLIIGAHALHAIAAILALGWAYVKLLRGDLPKTSFWTVQVFWYFVVGIWPLLYVEVYL